MNSRGNKYEFFCVLILVLLVSAKVGAGRKNFYFSKKITLLQFETALGGFTVCEDFGRFKQLKCSAPESLQAKREPNPSGANWKVAGSDFSLFANPPALLFLYKKKLIIQAI